MESESVNLVKSTWNSNGRSMGTNKDKTRHYGGGETCITTSWDDKHEMSSWWGFYSQSGLVQRLV